MKQGILILFLLLFSTICFAEKTGILEVNSQPSGAKIYIDGIYVGIAPYQNLGISPGRHEVEAFLNSYYPRKSEIINITADEPLTHTFYFTGGNGGRWVVIEDWQKNAENTGNVVFASVPTGAIVRLKGQLPQKTPALFKKVDGGSYDVEFKLNGQSLKGHFDVIENETVTFIADFKQGTIINKLKIENKRELQEKLKKENKWYPLKRVNDSVAFDPSTNLLWEIREIKVISAKDFVESYQKAESYCRDLTEGNVSGWRIPTRFELLHFHEQLNKTSFYSPESARFWVSDTCGANSHIVSYYQVADNNGRYEYFERKTKCWEDETRIHMIRCVKDGP